MRILVINPAMPRYSALGACEQDRLANISDLTRLGHTVRLLTQTIGNQKIDEARAYFSRLGIEAEIVSPARSRLTSARFRDMAYLDGASWQYGTPEFTNAVDRMLDGWEPELVWCHASYLWPAAARAARRNIPTVIRSVNYEPHQLFEENGRGFSNRVRFVGKTLGERHAVKVASVVAAITPMEQAIYQELDSRAHVELLPLRPLPQLLRPPRIAHDHSPLKVFFMGASYNIPHNRAALELVVAQIAPRIRELAPERFEFHILGSKVPASMQQHAAPDVIFDGYVPDLDVHLDQMDIALVPSRFGTGMQQKVFEALCRGFPTITHARALAGYAFEADKQVLLAETVEDFVQQLLFLADPAPRAEISAGASQRAASLFGRERLDACTNAILEIAVNHGHSPTPISTALPITVENRE